MKRLAIHYARCRIDVLKPPPKRPQTDVDVKQRDRNVENYESDGAVRIMALLG